MEGVDHLLDMVDSFVTKGHRYDSLFEVLEQPPHVDDDQDHFIKNVSLALTTVPFG